MSPRCSTTWARAHRCRPARPPGSTTRAATSGLSLVSYYNWGGYANDNTTGKTYNLVSASWTQPKVVCPKDEDRMAVFWVGLDGFNNATVNRTASGAYCSDGTALYFTWWEMYPTNSIEFASTSVAPGDKITASVSFAGGTYTLQVTDATTPANSFAHTATCGSDLTCANQERRVDRGDTGHTPWSGPVAELRHVEAHGCEGEVGYDDGHDHDVPRRRDHAHRLGHPLARHDERAHERGQELQREVELRLPVS